MDAHVAAQLSDDAMDSGEAAAEPRCNINPIISCARLL